MQIKMKDGERRLALIFAVCFPSPMTQTSSTLGRDYVVAGPAVHGAPISV